MGGRLRYADAIALYQSMVGDPASYAGADALNLAFPMDATDIVLLQLIGARSLLGDIGGKPETGKPTAEEIHEAETHMSKLFG